MSTNIVRSDLDFLLETIREQFSIIAKYSGRIPQIELDILMHNIRTLYERLGDLDRQNRKGEDFVFEKTQDLPAVEKVKPEKVYEEKTPENDFPLIDDNIPVSEKIPIKTETKKPLKSTQKSTADLFSNNENAGVGDKFKQQQKSVLDKFSQEKQDKIIADKINKKSISDLKSAIGINDKFLFINSLFKGNLQEYTLAIETLNSFDSLAKALEYFNNLNTQYNWALQEETKTKLEDFVLRKYM